MALFPSGVPIERTAWVLTSAVIRDDYNPFLCGEMQRKIYHNKLYKCTVPSNLL